MGPKGEILIKASAQLHVFKTKPSYFSNYGDKLDSSNDNKNIRTSRAKAGTTIFLPYLTTISVK